MLVVVSENHEPFASQGNLYMEFWNGAFYILILQKVTTVN